MPRTSRVRTSLCGATAAALIGCAASLQCGATPAASAAPGEEEVVAGNWQHHVAKFTYVGFTAFFTCGGLEDHVRQILIHLGARADARVSATGCPGPVDSPSRSAWVEADFYSLAASEDPAAAGAVQARWAPLQMSPKRPFFIRSGDCELFQAMKDLITKNFSLRDVEYSTSCFPHQDSLAGFEVKAEALQAVPVQNAVKG